MQQTLNKRFGKHFWPAVGVLLIASLVVLRSVLLPSHSGFIPNILEAPRPPPPSMAAPPEKGKKPQGKYPTGVPSKFDPDDNVQHFPGNTIVSHLSHDSELYASLLVLHEKLRTSPLAHLYAILPPASWHMTVFDGVCDQVRKPGYWPDDLAMDASMDECTALFTRKLRASTGDGDGEMDVVGDAYAPYRLRAVGFSPLRSGISLTLELCTPEEDRRFRGMRNRLAELLRIRHPDLATYRLHLSLVYMLRYLTAAQEAELRSMLMAHFEDMPKEFELGAPEFCTFGDMFAFDRLFYLCAKGGGLDGDKTCGGIAEHMEEK